MKVCERCGAEEKTVKVRYLQIRSFFCKECAEQGSYTHYRTKRMPHWKLVDHFEVKKIVLHRRRFNRDEYVIVWKDYPPNQASWEPEENLYKCLDLVNHYRRMNNMAPIFIPTPVGASSSASKPDKWKTLPEIMPLIQILLTRDHIKGKVEIWNQQEPLDGITYIFESNCIIHYKEAGTKTILGGRCQLVPEWRSLGRLGRSHWTSEARANHAPIQTADRGGRLRLFGNRHSLRVRAGPTTSSMDAPRSTRLGQENLRPNKRWR